MQKLFIFTLVTFSSAHLYTSDNPQRTTHQFRRCSQSDGTLTDKVIKQFQLHSPTTQLAFIDVMLTDIITHQPLTAPDQRIIQHIASTACGEYIKNIYSQQFTPPQRCKKKRFKNKKKPHNKVVSKTDTTLLHLAS